jgi:hypothetical protein
MPLLARRLQLSVPLGVDLAIRDVVATYWRTRRNITAVRNRSGRSVHELSSPGEYCRNPMTVTEALNQIEERQRQQHDSAQVSQQEVSCPETQIAVRILAAAYERVQKRDPLYGGRRRANSLPPPPGRVLPG